MKMSFGCAATLVFALTFAAIARGAPAADLIVHHARIWTVDRNQPEAEAVAVLNGRFVAVGADRDVDAWRGPETVVVDAGGHRLLPGFNDAHVHFAQGGADLGNVQLNDAKDPAEFARRIAAQAARTEAGEWLQGGNWDETKWPGQALPTHELIDAATAKVPVAVARYDGHMVLANALALRLAGITAATPDPAGGVIVRDAKGNPTGILKDAALDLLLKAIPAPSHAARRRAIEAALHHAAALGVTSVQDMNPEFADLAVYAELAEEGHLTTRVYAAPAIAEVDKQLAVGIRRGFGSPLLRFGAVKGYADGSIGSATAYFYQPFLDAPDNRGLLSDQMQPLSLMRDRMTRADAAGLQLCTHAIGDAGIAAILDLYAEIVGTHGSRDRRWRIEHAQHMAAADFDRFASLGVIASVQPYHAIDDGRWVEARIGHDRASRTYAFRTFLDHGVRLALGTDWAVAPLDPMMTLYAATIRATLDGRHPDGWFPEQKLTIREAVEAYTQGSAYAEFQEQEKGSISAGKLADMVLLERDILTLDPTQLPSIRVLRTWLGGIPTFEARGPKPVGR
jgi:predicted amidohydrolase YtcJ